jgi:hypothetical protein
LIKLGKKIGAKVIVSIKPGSEVNDFLKGFPKEYLLVITSFGSLK